MTANNDIVERLRALSRCEHSDLSVGDEAAAEIVRLRGEVENITAEAIEWRDKLQASTPAPAMPNGVEGLVEALEMPDGYEVQEFLPGGWHYAWTRSDGERMVSGTTWNHPALAAIAAWQAVYDRAADNRDAAGVDADEDAYVIEHMGKLLAEIAVIVNGPEPALTRWSYHDLPDKVRALKEAPTAAPAGEAVALTDEAIERALDTPLGLDHTLRQLVRGDTMPVGYSKAHVVRALLTALGYTHPPAAEVRELVEKCRAAFAEEMAQWDIDPPIAHVKEAHDACVAWLAQPQEADRG